MRRAAAAAPRPLAALRVVAALGLVAALGVVAACSPMRARTIPRAISGGGPRIVYAAIGAGETVGEGTDQPVRDAWPQVFFRSALPPSATFVNLAVPGVTVQTALLGEVPEALELHPNLVTVWLNVDDLLHGVAATTYEAELRTLVQQFRAAGASVLVADTPPVAELPVFGTCAQGAASCPPGTATPLPPVAQLNAMVDAYNAAIDRVARDEGAVVVDVRPVFARAGAVSDDGLDPSEEATPLLAQQFAIALRATHLLTR